MRAFLMQAIWLSHSNYTFRLPECEAPKRQQPKGWLKGVSRSTRTTFLYVQGPGPLAQAIRQAGKQICQIKLLTKTLPNIIAYQVFTPVTTLLAIESIKSRFHRSQQQASFMKAATKLRRPGHSWRKLPQEKARWTIEQREQQNAPSAKPVPKKKAKKHKKKMVPQKRGIENRSVAGAQRKTFGQKTKSKASKRWSQQPGFCKQLRIENRRVTGSQHKSIGKNGFQSWTHEKKGVTISLWTAKWHALRTISFYVGTNMCL